MHDRLNSSIRQNSENMGVGLLFKDAYVCLSVQLLITAFDQSETILAL
jgi:hypothetical protein